jgi:FtsP/CotA-like multicopper oxidase with cupredoxin domain
MKRTALLAVVAVLLAAGSAVAAPKAIRGVVVAKRAHGGAIVVATGKKGLAVTVKAAPSRFRLGERVSVVGTRVHVLSRVKTARIRGMVVKRLAHSVRVASGRSVLTIHTQGRSLASHGDGHEGEMGEFEVEFEHDGLFEHDFTPVSQSGTVEIEGTLVSVSPLVVSLEGLPVEIAVPSSVTLPALTPGQEVELTVQTGAGNTFTLVSIGQAENEVGDEVEAKGAVTNSTASQITIDAGDASLTFAAPTGKTLPILATGTQVEARGVTINGVLTLTRLRTDDDGDGGGSGGGGGGDH